jgi:hypothetical protein
MRCSKRGVSDKAYFRTLNEVKHPHVVIIRHISSLYWACYCSDIAVSKSVLDVKFFVVKKNYVFISHVIL